MACSSAINGGASWRLSYRSWGWSISQSAPQSACTPCGCCSNKPPLITSRHQSRCTSRVELSGCGLACAGDSLPILTPPRPLLYNSQEETAHSLDDITALAREQFCYLT